MLANMMSLFALMARKSLREPKIDTELAYAYGKTDRLHRYGGLPWYDERRGRFGSRREVLRGQALSGRQIAFQYVELGLSCHYSHLFGREPGCC